MYTARDVDREDEHELDNRIRDAVKNWRIGSNAASMRIYCEDWFARTIREELERRGFVNVEYQEDFVLKTDVYFEWN